VETGVVWRKSVPFNHAGASGMALPLS
jgi:hypothetical protein